jgi:hypothetical protein
MPRAMILEKSSKMGKWMDIVKPLIPKRKAASSDHDSNDVEMKATLMEGRKATMNKQRMFT